ncbi:hypothetical protein [Geobacter sp.]|uniref:ribonuclease toxin HepT-like protein n=1 Tax=Geobacter sp. TaxID=46610 RepID=UPI0026035896|nr:hypothetical protein [Geobacter sp.]
MKSDRLRTLKAELLADMAVLDELEGKYRLIHAKLATIRPDEFDYVGLAYTIVNLYNLMENYFLRVAKCFENNIDRLNWHRDLVRRMALEIDGVRPALLAMGDVSPIDELRAFRHMFRHIYQSELDLDKLKLVDSRAPKAVAAFRSAHERFVDKLDQLIALIEE